MPKTEKYPYFSRLQTMKSLLFCAVFVFFAFANPNQASAGFFSFLGFGISEASETEPINTQNSQNISLMTATFANNVDHVEESTTTSIDKTAINTETNLLGTTESVDLPPSDQISLYVVHQGDTLSSIAKMFSVTESTIRWANDLPRNATLKKDQLLTILPIDGVSYIVKKGDTLKSIAKKYGADAGEIAQFNDITLSTDLVIGQDLIIPDGEIVEVIPKKITSSNTKLVAKYTGPDLGGYFIRPTPGPRTQGTHGKNGADIGGKIGTPIYAAASGKVIVADDYGYNGGYGEYIVISHSNGTQTLYAHLSSVGVSVGQTVNQGDVIGKLGSTGKSTGPHLHFEVRGAVNPITINANYGR